MVERTYLNAWGRIASPAQRRLRVLYSRLCTDVIVNLNDGNRGPDWHTFYTIEDYAVAFASLRQLGCRVHVMSWVRPQAGWLFPMVDQLLELCQRCEPESVLLDLEGPWSRSTSAEREDAAEVIGHEFDRLTWGITDVPMVGWGKVAPLAEQADYWMPQIHTFGRREGIKPRPWYRVPGKLEPWTHKKWGARLSEGQRIIPHLADYRVGNYRQTPQGLRASIGACYDLGYSEVAAWTGMGGPSNPEVWRDLKAQAVAA